MKRLSVLLALGLPISAQWTVFDPTNLQQAIALYNQAQQYKQIAQNMAAFAHNPAQFLGYMASVEQMALNTATAAGVTTAQRAGQLQEIIRMQQVALAEAQAIQTISHQNMADMGNLANSIVENSNALAATRAELLHEQRVAYYQERSTYQPQAQIISSWRLK